MSKAAAQVWHDPRDPDRIAHSLRDLIAQRLYGLCCGYEDFNDHDRLRHDPLLQTAVGKVEPLASSPTFSRLENRPSRADILELNQVLVEQFIASHPQVSAELILDIDASDVPLHGDQEMAEFHSNHETIHIPNQCSGFTTHTIRLAFLVEECDPYTEGHLCRVLSQFSTRLTLACGFSK